MLGASGRLFFKVVAGFTLQGKHTKEALGLEVMKENGSVWGEALHARHQAPWQAQQASPQALLKVGV